MRQLVVGASIAAILTAISVPSQSQTPRSDGPRWGFCRTPYFQDGGGYQVSYLSQVFPTQVAPQNSRKTARGDQFSINNGGPCDDFVEAIRKKTGKGLQGTNFYNFLIFENENGARAELQEQLGSDGHWRYLSTAWQPKGGRSSPLVTKSFREAKTPPSQTMPGAHVIQSAKGPTPNQLKYQRELEAYKVRLAEIVRTKAESATRHQADTVAAEAELARHRRELAVAEAARNQYQQDLAAHQQLIRDRETKHDREAKVEWREAVAVCVLDLNDGQAKFGNWRCDGPLQMNYAKLGNPGQALSTEAVVALTMVCGGSREAVRDLGMVGDAHLFGCSYGIHPQSKSFDPLAKHGIGYVPGRATYRCPIYVSGCRTQ